MSLTLLIAAFLAAPAAQAGSLDAEAVQAMVEEGLSDRDIVEKLTLQGFTCEDVETDGSELVPEEDASALEALTEEDIPLPECDESTLGAVLEEFSALGFSSAVLQALAGDPLGALESLLGGCGDENLIEGLSSRFLGETLGGVTSDLIFTTAQSLGLPIGDPACLEEVTSELTEVGVSSVALQGLQLQVVEARQGGALPRSSPPAASPRRVSSGAGSAAGRPGGGPAGRPSPAGGKVSAGGDRSKAGKAGPGGAKPGAAGHQASAGGDRSKAGKAGAGGGKAAAGGAKAAAGGAKAAAGDRKAAAGGAKAAAGDSKAAAGGEKGKSDGGKSASGGGKSGSGDKGKSDGGKGKSDDDKGKSGKAKK